MVNGRYDFQISIETNLQPLFRLHGTPEDHERLVILESAHIPPRHEAFRETIGWLDLYLGSP